MHISNNTIVRLIFLFFFLSFEAMSAQGIKFREGSWQEILAMAREQDKLIFVDVYTTWCGPCKKMDRDVFSDGKVGTFYNEHYVPFKIDAEKGEGIGLAERYHVTSFPNLLVVDGNGVQINRHSSYLDAEGLLKFGRETLDSEREFTELSAAYGKGERDPETVLGYLALLKGRGLPTEEVALEHFGSMDRESWTSPENLRLVTEYIESPYNEVVGHLSENKEPMETISMQSKVYLTLYRVYEGYLDNSIKNHNDSGKDARILSAIGSDLYPREAEQLRFKAQRAMCARDGDWKCYAVVVKDHVENLEAPNALILNKFAYLFYKTGVDDREDLATALGWIDTALEKTGAQHPYHYDFLDTKVSLLYKLGRKNKALEVASAAIRNAELHQRDDSGIRTLIEKIKTEL